MPHINRIRVNNVKYNFGTQYYDDFVLRLSGKNTIYDLANGGGKSVLMLLLLQNMLPNCTLDEKQPIEKLFRSGNNNTVIHSLIEWRLNDSDVKNQYKYMTTGFCARKAQRDVSEENEAARDTASIEYFNYCIFYREFNANDIVNLPLADDKERISYNGLKSYLRSLEKKDYSLEIKIFERRGDYQRFISQYGIYESEWEIIRGINKTEGHVRTYFESNYKTTRKVIEDLFIDEIIEKSFRNKIATNDDKEDMMAKTLLDIKDKLVELSLKNSEIQNFDRQMEVLSGFAEQLDGLYGAYEKSDDAKETLLGIYGHVTRAEAKEIKERERLVEKRLELQGELAETKRISDTVQISIEEGKARKLSELLADKEEKIAFEEDKLLKVKEELTYKESVNDYLDYIYYKTERDRLKEELDNVMKDKGELKEELSGLAAGIKELTDSELKYLEREKDEQEKELTETIAKLGNAVNNEREADKDIAVFSDKLTQLFKDEKNITTRYNELQGQAELLIGTDVSVLLLKKTKLMEENEAVLCEHEKRHAALHDSLIEERINFERLGEEAARLNNEVKKNIKTVTEQREEKKRISAMKSAYGVKAVKELKTIILKISDDISDRSFKLNSIKKELGDILAAYISGFVMPKTKEHGKLQDYIERCYGYRVQNGEDYLLSKEQEDREQLIAEFPLLPFGFVVDEGLEHLSYDEKLAGERLQSYPVPIFLRSAIESGAFSEKECVIYPNNLGRWYADEEAKATLIKSLEQELSEVNAELKKNDIQKDVLYDDYDFVNRYISLYGDDEKAMWEEYERVNAELEEVRAKREEALLRLRTYEEETKQISEQLDKLKETQKLLAGEIECLKELEACVKELDRLSVLKEELIKGRSEAQKRQRELNAFIKELSDIRKTNEDRLANIKAGMLKLTKDWEELYRPFYKGGTVAANELGYDEAVLKFAGIKNALDKEYAGLEDKRQLINNYEYAMSRSLQSISYNGVNEELLRAEYEALRLVKADKDELLWLRDSINRMQSSLKNLQRAANADRDEKNRIEGGVSHAIKAIIEKYGVYEEVFVEGSEEQYVASGKLKIEQLTKELSNISDELLDFDDRTRDFALMKKELERIFKSENIVVTDNVRIVSDVNSIEALYEKTLKEFDRLRKEIYERREDFERAKSRLIEVLGKLNAHGLAMELREHVPVPVASSEVAELKNNIGETISCIKLEKERVMRGIEDMQAIKDNFENQCLQTCENIRLELDKLSKLSTIRMDDELISIISLKIPYEPEEDRKRKMSKHIDDLVSQADTIDNQSERFKYIRAGLAWKRLFAVIVTDMNAIRLNLYKRERIREQSRYLRYEEAVGSTGQSQGIYIQFLIGVINYIANINSPDAHTGLRKVIFIDNPFGAAKDIYIWEPIFKLLKTNNVQLVVPARGVTPAITGRFDVNYVLGQKLIGGRQQTVVVDYFSSVTRENLEYRTINYEQTTLEF